MIWLSIASIAAFTQFGTQDIPWGAKLDSIDPTIAISDEERAKRSPDPEGLLLGGIKELELPDGATIRMLLYFTPLSKELARITLAPPTAECSALLSEFRLQFGEGVDMGKHEGQPDWRFSDFLTNTRWDYNVFYSPGTTTTILCVIDGHPLAGAQFSK